MKYLIIILIITVICSANVYSSLSITGQSMYYGVRAAGLAGAFTAVNKDATGISYNPAAISGIERNYISAIYTRDLYSFDFINQNFLSFSFPIGDFYHSIAVFNTNLKYDFTEIFNFDSLDWRESNYSYTLAFDLGRKNYLGITAGYTKISNNITKGNASGYNFNVGYIGNISKDLTFGMSVNNLVSNKKWDSGLKEKEILGFRSGIKYSISNRADFLFDFDGSKDEFAKTLHIGGEYWLWHSGISPDYSERRQYFSYLQEPVESFDFNIFLRAGFRQDIYTNNGTGYSLGFSLHTGPTEIDYSFEKINNNIDGSHSVALKIGLGGVSDATGAGKANINNFDPVVLQRTMTNADKIAINYFSTYNKEITDNNNYSLLIPEVLQNEIQDYYSHIEFASKQELDEYNIPTILDIQEAKKFGLLLDVDYIITGGWDKQGDDLKINLKIYSTNTGQLIFDNEFLINRSKFN